MAAETTANYLCGAKKTVNLGDHLDIDLVCRIDMTENPEHPDHRVATFVDGVTIIYYWSNR